MPDDDPLAPRPFRTLNQFSEPSMPADETFQRLFDRARNLLAQTKPDEPLVDATHLGRATTERLDDIVPPPPWQPVLRDLALSYAEWLAGPEAGSRVQVVTLPPGGRGLIDAWTRAQDLRVIEAPNRTLLVNDPSPPAPDLTGEDVLVVPHLEDWFLRDAGGLDTIRALLSAIAEAERPVFVGCDSWAWAYLSKAADAAVLLPKPYTFQAYDGARLQAWFGASTETVRARGTQFRRAENGDNVFETEEPPHEYFVRLAARSLGIPWVAWALWRASISDPHPDEDAEAVPDIHDGDTFWIAPVPEPALPEGDRQSALLTLHALLIHGGLSPRLLPRVLPSADADNVVPVLIEAGLVERVGMGADMRLSVVPAAYPSVRAALGDAGLPRDGM
ncbi:hypothetical protein [uncultured Jannaschia sp.]|uniref:hypothetical protein n=1 Tax=uncultured Jannaschia sp. TaxID=293347 RepID=UPI0026184DCC|nr:hypothetical protein [uncultured Jannaschia sp.]